MLHKVCLCPCARVCAWVAWVNVCVRVCLRVCERIVFLLDPSDLKQHRSAPVIVHTTSHCHCNYTFVAWRQKRKASWRRLALKLYDARITARVSWLSNCPGFTRGSEHDPDVWCGVCAEWWVPLLKESTCSFHLFACVFLTKRSHASGNNRHPTMIKISTPKKAHVSMLHSFIPLEGWYSLAMRPRPWQFVMVFPRPGAEWIWTAHREARGTGCKWLQEDEQRHFRRIWPCVP